MKRLVKIGLWFVGIVIILLLLGVVGLKLFLPKEKVRQIAQERASEKLGRQVTVNDIDISIWGGLGLELVGVVVASPEGFPEKEFVSAEAVDLKLQLLPLLSKEIAIERFILENPRITMRVRSDGTSNFQFDFDDSTTAAIPDADIPEEAAVAAAAISFDALEIRNGSIIYISEPDEIELSADNFNLKTSLERVNGSQMRSEGKLTVNPLTINKAESIPTMELELEYVLGIDLNRESIALESVDLTLNGLNFTVTGTVDSVMSDLAARINLKSERLTADDLFALLPAGQEGGTSDYTVNGDMQIDVDLEYYSNREDQPLTYVGSAVLTNMNLSHKTISGELSFKRALLDFKVDNLRVNFEEGMFDGHPFKGHLVIDDFSDPSIDGELAGTVDLTFVKPFLPADSALELEGKAEFDLKFSGRPSEFEQMKFSGDVSITDAKYNSSMLPEALTEASLSAYFDNRIVNIHSVAANFSSGSLEFSGRATDLPAYLLADSGAAANISPELDGTIKGSTSLSLLKKMMPGLGEATLSGTAAFDLKINARLGKAISLRPFGSLTIADGAYNDSLLPEPIERFEADMQLTPDSIIFRRLSVQFPSSDANLKGVLSEPLPYLYSLLDTTRTISRKPYFLFTLSSGRFDIDRLFPEAVPGASGEEITEAVDSVSVIFLPDIDGAGTLIVDTLIYGEVEFTGINGRIRIKDRRVECYDVTGSVYEGSVSGKTSIDLTNFEDPVYEGSFQASDVEVNDFVSRFTRYDSTVYGKGNISGSYQAHGWEPDSIMSNMKMQGEGTVQSGRIVLSESAFKVLQELGKRTDKEISREQQLKNLKTSIVVENGRVRTDNLKTNLRQIGDLEIGGYYGFDESLDYKGSLLLTREMSEKLSAKGGVLGGLSDLLSENDQKRISLPVTVTGTVGSPKFNFDYDALVKEAGKKLEDKAGSLLKGLFKKKK